MKPLFTLAIGLAILLAANTAGWAQNANHCVDGRGMAHGVRLKNNCDYDVNVRYCCGGVGSMTSCQGSMELELIGADGNISGGSCEGWYFWVACPAPKVPTDNIRWSNDEPRISGPLCIRLPGTDT